MKRRRRRRFQTTVAEALEDRALLSASTLDTTFDSDGLTDHGPQGFDVEVQPNGQIVVGGSDRSGGPRVGTVARYNDDGTLDTAFGTGGIASIPDMGTVSDVEVLATGQILAAGTRNSTVKLYRLNADGTLDNSFTAPNVNFVVSGPYASIEVDSQDRIFMNHSRGLGTARLNRLNPDGTFDTPFGEPSGSGFGTFYSTGHGIFDFLQDFDLDSGDRPVAVNGEGIFRFTTDGFADTSFNGTGRVQVFPRNLELTTVEISDSGTIYVGGYDRTDTSNLTGIVEAYDETGNLLHSATVPDVVFGLELQSDGRVVVATGNPDGSAFEASLTRFNSDLTIDSTFGTPGTGVALSSMFDLEIDAQNRYVAVGTSDTAGSESFVARFTPGNYAPEAIDDTNSVTEDATPNTATGNVTANDTDFNPGDTLTVIDVNGSTANVGATVTLAYGTLVLDSDGTYTYTLDNSNAAVQALDASDTLIETVSYVVEDGSGEVSGADLTITIDGADEPSGPVELVNRELLVTGMAGPDVVTISANNGLLTVTYSGQPDVTFNESDVDRIEVTLGDGDDFIRVDFTDIPAFIDGGAGDDFLEGSRGDDEFIGGPGDDTLEGFSGDDTLIGGEGDDRIIGSTGNDFLSGGEGSDTVFGGSGAEVILGGEENDAISGGSGSDLIFGGVGSDFINAGSGGDILLGGSTNLSAVDLELVREEWTSGRGYTERVNNIRTGSGPVLNGVQLSASTVFDDGNQDLLFGNSGRDWYIGSIGDVLFGRQFFEELDVIF